MESVYKCRQADDGYRVRRRGVGVISFPRASVVAKPHSWYTQPSQGLPEGDKQINFGFSGMGACKFEVSHDRSNEDGLIRKHQKEVVTLWKSEVPV